MPKRYVVFCFITLVSRCFLMCEDGLFKPSLQTFTQMLTSIFSSRIFDRFCIEDEKLIKAQNIPFFAGIDCDQLLFIYESLSPIYYLKKI